MLIAIVPVAVLVTLITTEAVQPWPACVGILVTATAALVIAVAWARDHGNLLEQARDFSGRSMPPEPMRLGPHAVLSSELERLIRTLTERANVLERRLRTEEAIVGSLPEPMVVIAPDRSVLRANAAARTAFGPDLSSVLRHPGLRGAIDRTLALGTAQNAALSLSVPVAVEIYATVFALSPDGIAEHGGTRVAAVLSDRTRERAVDQMRADFVANASHELRTPLASLIGFIDTLRGPAADDPPAQARFLQIMAEQAQRMNRLIDDLLSLSRIELTEHQMPIGLVALPELMRWVAAAFEPQVIARGITLDVEAGDDLPRVPGDEDQLAQVLQNLLDNAVKYGREGGTVRVLARECPPDGSAGGRWPSRPGVTLAVSDDGAGIAREHLPRLTERFYRVDRGRSRAVGGTGLGLAIVKHIVNRHRGQMTIDSQPGQGATFTIWLPLASASAADTVRRLTA